MIRAVTVSALCVVLAACGGSGGNAAAQRTFSYGAPIAATSDQLAAAQTPLDEALSFQGTQDASAATSFTDPSHVTDALLGSLGTPVALDGAAARTALSMARQPAASYLSTDLTGFDDPACVTPGPGSVRFDRCIVTVADPDVTGKGGIDGSVTAPNGTDLDWSLTVTFSLTSTSQGATVSATLHRSGHLSVTPGTISGQLLQDLSVTVSAPGGSGTAAIAESVDLHDLTYQTAPTRCITGGWLEARRVWTQRPSTSTADLADRGVVVTWTGTCGAGTFAHSKS
jgi:hypothetical protein